MISRRLPQLFRMHGILQLSLALADTIADEQYVEEGSQQEVELRAVRSDQCRLCSSHFFSAKRTVSIVVCANF
jgi:hypothetical protein